MKEHYFKKWNDFRDWVNNFESAEPVYWRGQMNPDWPLASRFERKILELNGGRNKSQIYPYDGRYVDAKGKKYLKTNVYKKMRDSYLALFMRTCSGLRGHAPAKLKVEEWWALGRHYGLITPLLDWTTSPYIAAFFALSELLTVMSSDGGISYDDRSCAVYRLTSNNELRKLNSKGLKIILPTIHELARMQGQQGLFTWLDSNDFYELEGFLIYHKRSKLLEKAIISDQAVCDGMKDLTKHGINWRLLFPDLTGAAQHVNTYLDLPFSYR